MADVPEDVLVDILSRLPVKSLVRFRCVCKSWCALFNNPDFVSKHMKNQSKDDAVVLTYCPGKGNVFSFLSNFDDGAHDDFCFEGLDLHMHSKLPPCTPENIGKKRDYGYVMHGQSNGIVALTHMEHDIILCNPAIREFRILPKSCFHPFPQCSNTVIQEFPRIVYSEAIHSHIVGVGLGYDPRTDDYKVVRIINFSARGVGLLATKAEVFSARYNSTWREINYADINARLLVGHGEGEFFDVDGVCYWIGEDSFTRKDVLVSFDMANEVFSKTPLPDICEYLSMPEPQQTTRTLLGVFNNKSIALFVYPLLTQESCIEMWVAKEEFGLKKSWTKHLTIGPLLGFGRPLLLWKNGEELLHDASGRLFSYNLVTLENRNVPIDWYGPINIGSSFSAVTYKKTLVSVKARQGMTLQCGIISKSCRGQIIAL